MSGGEIYFVDSNLLLYYIDPVETDKRKRAGEWLDYLWQTGNGRLSWQVLHEFYWNAVRKMRLDAAAARGMVGDLSRWRPVDTTLGLVQRAWEWIDSAQLTYWDALIVAAAERSGATHLLSEDFQNDRRYEVVQVVNPFRRGPGSN